jgi:polyhydroxyalkanoate synthase subunit PhaC
MMQAFTRIQKDGVPGFSNASRLANGDGIAAQSTPPETYLDRTIHAAIAQATGGFSPMAVAEAWFDWSLHLAVSPGKVIDLAMRATEEASEAADIATKAALGEATCVPCQQALPHDKRFRHESWSQFPYSLLASGFLSTERLWDEATSGVHGATQHHLQMINFVGRQALDLMAPSNFVLMNPEIMRTTIHRFGANLVEGAWLAFEDAQRMLKHERSKADEAFEPGKTVAVTPGKIVLRTPLAEVIQYIPTTRKVHAEPIVIVPAWIMKYYILDLQPHDSLVKHLVDEGFTVFVISWKNPTAADRDVSFDDYRQQGVLQAIDVALAITGAQKAHAVGYCIGGTLLAITLAAMARDGDQRLGSATFLAAQTDFTEAGELRLFVDESQLAMLDDMMWQQGTLEAQQMAGTFHLLRSNDLIWSRMIRRYLLGQREAATDIAAWSSDATRLPYRMHSDYLRQLYLNNDLAAGKFQVDGKPVALQDIKLPIFAVGTEWDHVAPWRSVHKLHLLTESPITFVLTNGGHNQGIVSPPTRQDRHYRIRHTAADAPHADPDEWLRSATYQEGSWWPAWFSWLSERAGPFGDVPPVGGVGGNSEGLGSAPGVYVHQ